jgi:CRP-like cAMP-binding protein
VTEQDRETSVLAWLRELGSGEFTRRQVQDALGLSRDHVVTALARLERRGEIRTWQWAGHYGTGRYQLGPRPGKG